MSLVVEARPVDERDWARGPIVVAVRSLLQRLLLFPVVRFLCRPVRVTGLERLSNEGPFVFVANHASHADTALLLSSLPPRLRRRTAPAAAEDYFFSSRRRGILVSLLIGAFPFPRCGPAGIHRARALLDRGWSVILFPEGTRSTDGRVHDFKAGVGILASSGATIVPVGLAGTAGVLPKGAGVPRRAPVAVAFGRPLQSAGVAGAVRRARAEVVSLAADAAAAQPAALPTVHARFRAIAAARRGRWLCFAWGFAEALLWPVIPDFAVAPLALASPASFAWLAFGAAAGSVAGGAVAYVLGGLGVGAAHLPLVTPRMAATAAGWLAAGPAGLLRQPLSGIPYKAFAYQAAAAGNSLPGFLGYTFIARGFRLLVVAGVFAAAGVVARRWWPRLFGAFLILFTAAFLTGLARVVGAWS